MATADEYASWIVKNADKKGTPDFDVVAKAYQDAKSVGASTAAAIPGIDGANTTLTKEPKDSFLQKVGGVIEAPLAMASGAAGGVVGSLAGLYKGLTGGKYGTAEGVREADKFGGDVAQSLTYQPRTQTGNAITQAVGGAINDSGIIGAPLGELATLGRTMAPAKNAISDIAGSGAATAIDAGQAGINKIASLVRPQEPAMVGVSAAETGNAIMRAQRAASLPVPIQLTKGQATRTFEDQRFERETAKLPEGGPLRDRFAAQNQQILQNFDAFADETGMQEGSLRAVGKVVNDAVVAKMAKAKGAIRTAYNEARDAGDMQAPVDVRGILKYVEDNRPAAVNAPILTSIEQSIKKLDPENTGMVSINDLEEMRKMTGRLSQPGTPNSVYGGDVKKMIDAATEGKGGALYQQARRLNENYSNEFKNTGVIDKLLRNKPGTNDRAVAYEDVFKHSILSGSLDDVRAVRRTLQTAGSDGEQAWRELQGQTVQHMKDEMTSNSARDTAGRPVASPDKLDKIVKNLDTDGKLDFIFGKKAAQQIRDVNDMAKDVLTSPPGAVNTSNTASVLIGLLDTAVSGISGVPLPIGTAINFGVKRVKTNILNKKVGNALESLVDDPEIAAPAPKPYLH
jgi:hypothetical protein